MIYIVKKHEPRELTEYRESESSTGVRPTYDSMSSDLHEYVLSKLVEEQGGLCAYCMCRIPETDKKTGSTLKCTIEHIEPQSLTRGTENLKKELEYSNFLAVCSGNENRGALCCDKSRGNKKLFLTPLNPECNHLIQYSLSGKIQAAETIPDKEDRKELDYELNDILNLNDGKDLKAKRKSALDGMLSVLQKQHKDQDVEECRRKFDFSLRYAKAMGKNSFYSFQQEDYNAFLRKEKIISALRCSIAEQYKGFNVYYQPIMDCATETITGAEALMRFTMDSEEGPEVISPIEFIPLLEETGLIIPAGKFVLKEAAKMCREIRRFIPGFQMNINVSYAQIAGGNVEDDIIETIKEHALDPANICVEMTESRLIDMTIPFIRFRHKLKDSRIRFAIDDFGTGYSNLHCINDIKPDYIKIDRDFTAKAMNGQRDYELLKSIITMIHSVNAKICIEGIEQGEWRQEMEKMGADSLQGYFYGRPCNKSDFMANYIRGAYICRS